MLGLKPYKTWTPSELFISSVEDEAEFYEMDYNEFYELFGVTSLFVIELGNNPTEKDIENFCDLFGWNVEHFRRYLYGEKIG